MAPFFLPDVISPCEVSSLPTFVSNFGSLGIIKSYSLSPRMAKWPSCSSNGVSAILASLGPIFFGILGSC